MKKGDLVLRGIETKKICLDCGKEMRLTWMNIENLGDDLAAYSAFFEYYCAGCGEKEASFSKIIIERV